jgi:hypothetical protein
LGDGGIERLKALRFVLASEPLYLHLKILAQGDRRHGQYPGLMMEVLKPGMKRV